MLASICRAVAVVTLGSPVFWLTDFNSIVEFTAFTKFVIIFTMLRASSLGGETYNSQLSATLAPSFG